MNIWLVFFFQFTHKTLTETWQFGPAFNKTFLLEVFRLQEAVEQLGQSTSNGLEMICFAPMTYAYEKQTLDKCTVQSIFGYFQNSIEIFLLNSTDIEGNDDNYLNKLDKCFTSVH